MSQTKDGRRSALGPISRRTQLRGQVCTLVLSLEKKRLSGWGGEPAPAYKADHASPEIVLLCVCKMAGVPQALPPFYRNFGTRSPLTHVACTRGQSHPKDIHE